MHRLPQYKGLEFRANLWRTEFLSTVDIDLEESQAAHRGAFQSLHG